MYRAILAIVSGLVVAGCGANFVTAYRSHEIEKGRPESTAVIDAKQRAIVATDAARASFANDPWRSRETFVCAEPSPDALSAISSSFSASGGFSLTGQGQAQAAFAQSLAEVASQLGKRNATVQLLRDGLYRQCEAYLNGLIDSPAYDVIANKYVAAMVTLLAIEELTPETAKGQVIRAGENATVEAGTEFSLSVPTEPLPSAAPNPPDPSAGEQATDQTQTPSPAQGAVEQPQPEPNPPSPETNTAATAVPETDTNVDQGTVSDNEQQQQGAATPNGEGNTSRAKAVAKAPGPAIQIALNEASPQVPQHVSKAVADMVKQFQEKDTRDFCLINMNRLASGTIPLAQAGKLGAAFNAFFDLCTRLFAEREATVQKTSELEREALQTLKDEDPKSFLELFIE